MNSMRYTLYMNLDYKIRNSSNPIPVALVPAICYIHFMPICFKRSVY